MVSFRDPVADAAALAASAGVIDAIVETDRMLAMLTAARHRLVAVAHATRVPPLADALAEREFRAELAAVLRISERGAARLGDEADVLTGYLPATLDALAEGRITPRQARVLVDALGLLEPGERAALEREALAAADESAAAFERTVRRLRETRDADTAVERHRRAREGRQVTCQPGTDGMAWLVAHLPAAVAVAIDSRLDDLARGLARDGDARTIGQLRADALGDVLLDRDGRALRRFGDARPTVVVTVPIDVLAGSPGMGELHGFGPIDATMARELAAEAPVLRRILTDPRDDAMLALDRRRYRVSDDLRLFLTVRDGRCRFVGCSRRTGASDLDHSRAWADGGTTDAGNLAHLCRGHHTLKHDSRWRLEAHHPDGTIDWLSPTGRRFRTRPERARARPGPDEPG